MMFVIFVKILSRYFCQHYALAEERTSVFLELPVPWQFTYGFVKVESGDKH